MNRHERRGAKARGEAPEIYERAADAHYNFFRWFLRKHANDPPRFALLAKEFALFESLDRHELGHRLARNDSAHELIDSFIELANRIGIEPPTYLMLRAFIDSEKGFPGLETETVTAGELGFEVQGMRGAGRN